MVDAAALGDRIEERKDLGAGDEAVFAYWQAQEAIAEKEERNWIKRARNIVKRYRDERGDTVAFTGEGKHQFNVLWSNVQTLLPTLYARTPKPDVERRFKDEDPVGRLASTLMERCLSYSLDAGDFDSVMKSVVQDRLLPGRGVARVLYVPTFGEKMPAQGEEAESVADSNVEAQGSAVDNEGDENKPDDEASEGEQAEPLREVTYEEALAQYVFWEDYREGPARQWCEVPWVRYQSYLTRDALIKRFGKTKGAKVNLDFTPKGMSGDSEKDAPPPDLYKKAIVREYWDKSKKQAVWIAPGTPDLVLDTKDDPLKLQDFFPNPDPLLSTTTNEKRIPVPDYVEYQDQARELDNLTARIDKLTAALQVKGVYPGENKQVLQQLFDSGTDNTLVPVEDWMAFADKGGLEKMILWVPIKQIAETLIQLYNARDRVKALLYEITGLSDILRGETNPNETFGAQELKANFATRRITPQQKDVAKFARDMLRLIGGVIAEHFSAKTISMITGYPQLDPVPQLPPHPQAPPQLMMQQLAGPSPVNGGGPQPAPQPGGPPPTGDPMGGPQAAPPPPDPAIQAYQAQMAQWQQALQQVQAIVAKNQQKQQAFDQAVALIKSDGMHGFRIDIEADSTIAPDEQQDQQARTQFMQQFVPFMEQIIPICMGNPAMAAMGKEMTDFILRGYKVARPLEESIDKAFSAFGQMPQNPKAMGQDNKAPEQQGADPHEVALRAHEIATKAQTDQTALQVKAAADQANVQAKVATAQSSDSAKVIMNRENNAVKLQVAGDQQRTDMVKLAEQQRQHSVDTELEAQRIADAHKAHMASEQNKSAARLT